MDGCGKTTQINALSNYLKAHKIKHICTREPGGCPFAEMLRDIFLAPSAQGLDPVTQALLMTAARKEHITRTIQPALENNKWVLCDRFMDSTTVYQGYVQNVSKALINQLHKTSAEHCMPNLTFILTLSLEEAEKRLRHKSENHFDTQALSFHQKVQSGFIRLARTQPDRYKIISADKPVDQVTEDIVQALEEHFYNDAQSNDNRVQ